MATTIKSSTLRVKIQESITLDGSEQGTVTTKAISGINAISKRLVTVTATEAVIATFSAAVASVNLLYGMVIMLME